MESDPGRHFLGSEGGEFPEYVECFNMTVTIKWNTRWMEEGRGNVFNLRGIYEGQRGH